MSAALSIIIVNWNGKEDVSRCLLSVMAQNISPEVIVVDNASSDGSPEMIRNSFPWVKLIEMNNNVGFSKANNVGINISHGEYILLLNPDTVVAKGNLDAMLSFMEQHPDVGVSTSVIYYPSGKIQYEAGRRSISFIDYIFRAFYLNMIFPNTSFNYQLIGNWSHGTSQYVECISGAYMFVRKSVFETVGLLDEHIFMDFEDTDFCYRVRRAGWRIWYESSTSIVHFTGTARRKSNNGFSSRDFELPYYFFYKNCGTKKARQFRYVFMLYSGCRLFIALFLLPFKRALRELSGRSNLFNYKYYFRILSVAVKRNSHDCA